MKYSRIIAAVLGQFWAMQPDKLQAMLEILNMRTAGDRLSDSEIQARIGVGQEKQIASQQGDVMVLPLQGVISNRAPMVQDVSTPPGTSAERFTSQFRAALNDSRIKAIVIDVNSPGGTVGGVDELATEIFNARGVKPVIAQVNAYAASAAYWIASAAEEMVVTPSGEVGSIGVFALHEDVSQLMEREGIKPTLISAGTFKVEGNPYEPLTDDAKAAIQDDVNAYYDMFVRAVARNRGAALKTVREGFGQGRMVRSDQAVSLGMDTLVDLLMDNTIDREGFELKKKRLKARQYEIDLLLKSYDEADDSYNDMLLNLVELSAKSLEYFKGSDLQRQREILNMVFQNLSLNGKKLEYTMRSPFKEFAEVSNIEQWSE